MMEQPLPPYGACLLGSFNLTQYVINDDGFYSFDFDQFREDIPPIIRAMDNVHNQGNFPLKEQAKESHDKRRMGIGVTGLANAVEAVAGLYGSPEFLETSEKIFTILRDEAYLASANLAEEKGSFPLFDKEKYLESAFIKTLPDHIRDAIAEKGIRNSHLLSIAPTGTISLCANNCSGGIEPVFSYGFTRTIQTENGPVYEDIVDYGYKYWGVKGKRADECSASEHLSVLELATRYVDSAVSKTINIDGDIPWSDFKAIYMNAYEMGCKGCTAFNKDGKRFGILVDTDDKEPEPETAKACYIDPETGQKECS